MLELFRHRRKSGVERLRFAVTRHNDCHAVTRRRFAHQPPELRYTFDVLAVKFRNDVTGFEAGFFRRAVFFNIADVYTTRR